MSDQQSEILVPISLSAHDLATGDHLLRLGGVGFAQLRDRTAPPVIVADTRPPLEGAETDSHADPSTQVLEILTSAGALYARPNAPVLILRRDVVSPATVLLVSRRASLHARLVEFGVPVVRRTPLEATKTVAAVSATEWSTAPLIVIDGYLSRTTIAQMWARGDLPDRDQIIMVGTDPDDVRVYQRKEAANARLLALLPYDKHIIASLFQASTANGADHDPFLGILTPHAD